VVISGDNFRDWKPNEQLQPPPAFFDHRLKLFESLKAEYDEFLKGKFLIHIVLQSFQS